tara:strand:- start:12021 stop:12299 length:279 start_codon:yes stop_codon:yes gene_type:complete
LGDHRTTRRRSGARNAPERAWFYRSETAEKEQDKEDDENDTQTAARKIAPVSAVRPSRDDADEGQNNYDQQNCTKRHDLFLKMIEAQNKPIR